MMTPFGIPVTFNLDDSTKLTGPFTNMIVDFHKITDETARRWQQYLYKFAASVEIESDAWAVIIMDKSTTNELKTIVSDDLQDLVQLETGAITTFKIATNHMVLRNQETINSLHK